MGIDKKHKLLAKALERLAKKVRSGKLIPISSYSERDQPARHRLWGIGSGREFELIAPSPFIKFIFEFEEVRKRKAKVRK